MRHIASFLLLCCLSLVPSLSGEDRFWEKQAPSAWTPAQVTQFTTTSPWAKQVTAVLTSNDSNMAADTSPRPGAGGGRRGGTVISNRGSSSATTAPSIPKFQAIVRWVNSPMLLLVKPKLPDSFKGHYIVSVSGLPIGADPTTLTEQTTLQMKRGEPVHPEISCQDPNDTASIYFAFLPSMLDVSSVKTAEFKMEAAPFEIRAKFNLSDMKIHGEPSF